MPSQWLFLGLKLPTSRCKWPSGTGRAREGRCHRIHQDVVVVHNILPCFALQSAAVVVVVLATSFAELLIPVSGP